MQVRDRLALCVNDHTLRNLPGPSDADIVTLPHLPIRLNRRHFGAYYR